MLTHEQAEQIVLEAVTEMNELLSSSQRIEVSAEAQLFGVGGKLDSMELVSLVCEIEEAYSERSGKFVSLTSEKAMSLSASPFRNVASLANHLLMAVNAGTQSSVAIGENRE